MTFKLSSVEAQTAWEDFRDHLIDLDVLGIASNGEQQERHALAKMAFKNGFAIASSGAVENPIHTGISVSYEKTIKRNRHKPIKQRTYQQMGIDNEALEKTLIRNIEPMKLERILYEMRRLGHKHWNSKNATAYVKHAMKYGMLISKTGHAFYAYDPTVKVKK